MRKCGVVCAYVSCMCVVNVCGIQYAWSVKVYGAGEINAEWIYEYVQVSITY